MSLGLKIFWIQIIFFILIFWCDKAYTQSVANELPSFTDSRTEKYNSFYDSLKSMAEHKKITKFLHKLIFSHGGTGREAADTTKFLKEFEGKTIGQINIIRLDVFGPSLRDTSRKATLWYEMAGNYLHTTSDLHNIRKNLLFKKGEILHTPEIYENERLLRALPYIKDARFYVKQDSLDTDKVDITVVTQDRFSIGVTGVVNGWNSAALEIYNRNIFGIGDEISARFVGHLAQRPLMGMETFYKINNLLGRFISLTTGYSNTYLDEGAMLVLNKPFLRVSDTWGYGLSGYYYGRTGELPEEIHLIDHDNFGYRQFGGWAGRNFQVAKGHSQLTVSSQYIYRRFSDRPNPLTNGEQFYKNTNLYLLGLTWSKRTFHPDELIYSYGITEDIPKGFKYEWVAGYDNNEFGKRYYSHVFIAHANILPQKPGYLYASSCFSNFLKSGKIEQGILEFNSYYISRLFTYGNLRFREFVNLNYILGIHRMEAEKLFFEKDNLIRGFASEEVLGNRRLSIEAETVCFLKHDFYRFNIAVFSFADLGIMNSGKASVFKGNYYSGLGIGLRLHNESLVLKTLQIRLAFYPNHPHDVGLVGFLINEQNQQHFYSFQPEPPSIRKFE